MSLFLYHGVPPNMEGEILYPLNQLKAVKPEAYAAEVEKYQGREFLLETKIPILDCLWNDVIHLSPIHPSKIKEAFALFGATPRRAETFEIPAEMLDTKLAVIQYSPRHETERTIPFSIEALKDTNIVPQATIEYYKYMFEKGSRPLAFAHTPHILYKGTIDTKDLKRIMNQS